MTLEPKLLMTPRCLALIVLTTFVSNTTPHAIAVAADEETKSLPPYHSPFPISDPKLFANASVSTTDFESHPGFMPGGRTLFYVKSTPDYRFRTIVSTTFAADAWSIPVVAPFSGKFEDGDPFIANDGSRMFYSSNRPAEDYIGAEPAKHLDLWVVGHAADSGWGTPKNLGTPVNSEHNESTPAIAADGTIYFGSDRPGGKGGGDLYRCRVANDVYGPAENLGDSINTGGMEGDPWIAPDQSYLIFAAKERAGGRGGADLYVSYARGNGWTKPVNLGDKINSPLDDFSPRVSPDGEYFFWTSCRSFATTIPPQPWEFPALLARIRRTKNGLGDIYQIDLKELGLRAAPASSIKKQ